ncbi:HD-GYP domain-containing protein [Rhodoferax sp. PAMC 29310]|uniref:HD-GYP domain-containing protein n=1 Tax=Rhodoferax sp. PAMC 29310 TaxID=2822760 RepID=UPI001B327C2D|nr:HD domain-containing phosphohydrolase [Rhodoferax sp. PAMC 29310]
MSEIDTGDQQHFTQAVAKLGETQVVVAHCAIFNDSGVKIVDKGVAINQALYKRLTQHKLSAPIENCVASANGLTGDSLRDDAKLILDSKPLFGRMAPDNKTRDLFLDALQTLPLPAPIALQLTIARDLHPPIYQHLLRTALTAAWLSKTPLLSRFDVNAAVMAGMLHDIGMLHVDPRLMQPSKTLNREQRRQLYVHPLVSTALIERHHQYPKEVVRAVREHHEYLDGSGYPRNLTGDAIGPLARILGIAQVVAAMFSSNLPGAELRLSVLLRMNTHRFDATLAMQVIGLLRPKDDMPLMEVERAEQPLELLRQINVLMDQWPDALLQQTDLSSARLDQLHKLGAQLKEVRRALAKVGAAPDQLTQLGESLDDDILIEISLITREAAWQLRTLARQTRSRWKLGERESYPEPLSAWIGSVQTMVRPVFGQADAGSEAVEGEDVINAPLD